MKFHPVADLFPMMSDIEIAELSRDIAENGLREPIWTYQNKIIDGRNRFKACEMACVKPLFLVWDGRGSLISLVLSLNMHRRHLSTSQKSMIGARALPMFEAEAKQRQREHGGTAPGRQSKAKSKGKASSEAAKAVGVSARSIEMAAKVIKSADADAIAAVDKGDLSVSEAAKFFTVHDAGRGIIYQVPIDPFRHQRSDWDQVSIYLKGLEKRLKTVITQSSESAHADTCTNALRAFKKAWAAYKQYLEFGK